MLNAHDPGDMRRAVDLLGMGLAVVESNRRHGIDMVFRVGSYGRGVESA